MELLVPKMSVNSENHDVAQNKLYSCYIADAVRNYYVVSGS